MKNNALIFLSGIGIVFLIYVPLRGLEHKPAIFFILTYLFLSILVGGLTQKNVDKETEWEKEVERLKRQNSELKSERFRLLEKIEFLESKESK